MKIAFYGANRVAKDFYYVLKDTEMEAALCFADAGEDAAGFAQGTGLETVPVASLPALRANFDMLVVCDFSHEEKEQTLQAMGLAHGKDYQWVEEFFPLFDDVRINPEQKPMLVWGCGRKGEQFYHWNTEYEVEAYLDRAPQGEDFYGYPCRKPETVREWSRYFVVVAVARNEEICDFLEQQGGKRYRDFCTYEDIESLPSTLLRQTILQPEVYDFTCRSMLNHAEVGGRGNVICCCSTFIRNSLGDLSEERSFRDCWNSVVHRILCLSNVNRTYSFCLHDMCPLFIGRHETRDYHLSEPYPEMEDAPRTVAVGFDYTCNLKCVTCRKDFRVAKEADKRQIQSIAAAVRDQVLPGCEFLIMAGVSQSVPLVELLEMYVNDDAEHRERLEDDLLDDKEMLDRHLSDIRKKYDFERTSSLLRTQPPNEDVKRSLEIHDAILRGHYEDVKTFRVFCREDGIEVAYTADADKLRHMQTYLPDRDFKTPRP